MCADVLDPIRKRIQSGNIEGARRSLFGFLRKNPNHITGWMLLAELMDDPQKQADCYRQVLRLDPTHNQAAARLTEIDVRHTMGSQNEMGVGEDIGDNTLPMVDCPNCGAQLSIDLTDTHPRQVICDYCQTGFLLPEKIKPEKIPVIY